MDTQVTCPNCRSEFPIDQIMSAQLADKIRSELEATFSKKTRQLDTEALQLAAEREKMAAMQEQLEVSAQQFKKKVREAVANERKTLESDARVVAQQAVALEIKDRDEQLTEATQKIKTFQQQELQLRKEKRQLKEQAEQQELEVTRRLDEERQKIRATTLAQAQEQNQLKQAEKDQQIESMRKKIDELKIKAEQGSQQLQGEVQELALEAMLPSAFPGDVIKPVAKGVKGADVLQHVFDNQGRECGTILWESKRTKTWSDKWLSKLRDDQQEAKASCACIVTAAMPEAVQHFDVLNDVWVTSWSCTQSVAIAMRRVLIETAQARLAMEGHHGKMELTYNYLSGAEFRNRVRGLIEAYVEMQQDLEKEKQLFDRQWNKRQKQLDRALMSTNGLFGDLQGIMGSSLPEIEGAEVLALETES